MNITIKKSGDDAFELAFDDTKVTLASSDIKNLLLEATKILMPGGAAVSKPDVRAKNFAKKFQNAEDVGVQNFIREANPDDLLVLLKVVEKDGAMLQKFYSNMSDRLRKMMEEDLAFKFKEDVPPEKIAASLNGLIRTARELEKKGSLALEED